MKLTDNNNTKVRLKKKNRREKAKKIMILISTEYNHWSMQTSGYKRCVKHPENTHSSNLVLREFATVP